MMNLMMWIFFLPLQQEAIRHDDDCRIVEYKKGEKG